MLCTNAMASSNWRRLVRAPALYNKGKCWGHHLQTKAQVTDNRIVRVDRAAAKSAHLCRAANSQSYRCGAVAARVLERAASRPTRCKFVEVSAKYPTYV